MDFVELTSESLDVSVINNLVVHESCGAASMFVGTTRDNFEDKKVISLQYEAYEPMAIKTMKAICDDTRSKWPDIKNIAIYHRLGTVPIKEASVVIAISSPHRQSSLQAVQHAIDELKKSVPIWKKEQYENNDSTWKENKELFTSNSRESKLFKRPKLNFDSCRVDTIPIPKNLIQINADETEVLRRIQCFVEKKREEININNTLEFIDKKLEPNEDENSCARVNSIVIKQKESKGHLRIHRVKNEYGPQIKSNYTHTLDKLMKNDAPMFKIKDEPMDLSMNQISLPVAEQRLQNIEKFLKINTTTSRNIYDRLKTIEDRLLFLEATSPEYHHFLGHKKENVLPKPNKSIYSVEDLDKLIQNMNGKVISR